MRARDFVALVLSGAPSIRHVAVLRRVLRQASTAIRRYADPAWRQDGLAQLDGRAARPGCGAPSPAPITSSPTPGRSPGSQPRPDLDLLAGLLDGSATIEGLAVDTELRWQLLHRLVSRGRPDQAEIEAELASATAPTPASGTRRAAWPRSRRRTRRQPPGRRSPTAACPTPRSARHFAASPTRIRTSCSRRTRPGTTTRWPACGRTASRTWRSSSPSRVPGQRRESAQAHRGDRRVHRQGEPAAGAAAAAPRAPRRRGACAALPPAGRQPDVDQLGRG